MAGQKNSYGKRSYSQSDYTGNEESKRRNSIDERDSNHIGRDDTVYRYLCPVKRIGSIIGKGGEIAKQLRAETHAKIRISDTVPGCEERIVTIYSSSEETNSFGDYGDDPISPAQDALFRVHERIVAEESPGAAATDDEEEFEKEVQQVTARLLVPSDQIGGVIGKGGQVIQDIRSETGAQVRIRSGQHLPPCALNSDELIQISGEAAVVRKALYQVASRLHDNPSRTQHLLLSASNNHRSGGTFISPNAGVPPRGMPSLMGGAYGSYGNDTVMEFTLRFICPNENIGGVIGKGGGIIKQIRQESGAAIKVDSAGAEGDDCIISISAKESFEEAPSPAIDAALRLQPRCSEKTEKEVGDPVITTRLLVPTSRVGCLIGKGGSIINEMRSITRATIRILSKENLPKVASEDDEMVQITGDLSIARQALLQVMLRLRANIFDMEGALPYVPMSVDMSDGSRYGSRDSKPRGHGYSSYRGGYDSGDFPLSDSYGSYDDSRIRGGSGYGSYGAYSSRSSHGKHHGY